MLPLHLENKKSYIIKYDQLPTNMFIKLNLMQDSFENLRMANANEHERQER